MLCSAGSLSKDPVAEFNPALANRIQMPPAISVTPIPTIVLTRISRNPGNWLTKPPNPMKPAKSAGEVMVTRMVTIPADMILADAARRLVKHRIGSAPVVIPGEHNPIGELSRQACTDALLEAVYEGLPTDRVSTYLLPWKSRITSNSSIVEMVGKFRDCSQRLLPVYKDDHFLGIVTRSALIRTLLGFLEHMPDHDSHLLYLSALRERDEAPGL